jgi:hypothetical protein
VRVRVRALILRVQSHPAAAVAGHELLLAPASGEKSGAACADPVALDWLRCFEHAAV